MASSSVFAVALLVFAIGYSPVEAEVKGRLFLWGNKKWESPCTSIKVRKVEKFWSKMSLTTWKWSNLNALSTGTPVSHPFLGESLFPISSPCCFPSYSLWGNKKWFIIGGWVKKRKYFGTKSA